MTKSEGDGPGEGSLRRIVEQIYDVLEDEIVIVTHWNLKVIRGHAVPLAILDKDT